MPQTISVSFSVFEPLTSVLLKRLRPSILILVSFFLERAFFQFAVLLDHVIGTAELLQSHGRAVVPRSLKAGLSPGVGYFLSC